MTEASELPRRSGTEPVRLAIVLLLAIIALGEYDWLTTPWWLLTVKICGPGGIGGLVNDFVNWVINRL